MLDADQCTHAIPFIVTVSQHVRHTAQIYLC